MAAFGTMRVFAALNVEVGGVRRVVEAAERLKSHPLAPPARWVAPTKLHVTVKFFGEVDEGLAPALRDALGPVARERPAPRIAFHSFAAFPSIEAARVVFAEVDDGSELASIASAVETATHAIGVELETRPYRPHMTVARLTEPADVRPWLDAATPWKVVALVPELVLYRSDVARPGAEYDALFRVPFAPRKSMKKER